MNNQKVMYNNGRFACLIVAAGSGTRLGGDIPKQYLPLMGKPVLRWSIDALASKIGHAHIRVAIDPAHLPFYNAAVSGLPLPPPILGGATRQETVRRALAGLTEHAPEFILIHDAARPLVAPHLIESLCSSAERHGNAIPALTVVDTLKRQKDGKSENIDRTNLFAVQTPQVFRYAEIKALHDTYADAEVTDDSALLELAGSSVNITGGCPDNIKITYPQDIERLEGLLSMFCGDVRTGSGYDVHRLIAKTGGRPLMIGGIEIPHDMALEGHSDADVVLHAITDALLGSIGESDIGTHFSPRDARWKDADSAQFLRHAAHMIAQRGGIVAHVDATVICEAPKIGPHREAMRNRISDILSLPLSRISIKATTTEKLGFTGRGEGIAAEAIVTVRLPFSAGGNYFQHSSEGVRA